MWPKSNPLWLYSVKDKYIQGIRSDRQSTWRSLDRGLWHCTGGSDEGHPQEKEMQRGKMVSLKKPYKQLRKEEMLKAKEKMKDILILMQSFKEQQGEIRKLSSRWHNGSGRMSDYIKNQLLEQIRKQYVCKIQG